MSHHQPPASPPDTKVVLKDLHFPEGARRGPDGALYISDVYAFEILRIDPHTYEHTSIASVPNQPSGLGWLPDGRMLIVSMRDLKLLRLEPSGEVVEHADLSSIAVGAINDMFVDDDGRAWVGDFGFDYYGLLEREPDADPLFGPDANPPSGHVTRIDPDGSVHDAAPDMRFPNGIVAVDEHTLVVAETLGFRLTAFTIGADGTLTDRRVWADLATAAPGGGPISPDGLALGPEGTVWVADPGNAGAHCVEQGGRVRQHVQASQACFSVLEFEGSVLCCTAETSNSNYATAHATGLIESTAVALAP
ncbi:SMP-30/gluconolactonase/LRE family protein [Rhodococcus sp. 14-2496-1d]|uniref:SMP-30/gluconolactonase/LRE family protein n=1 Tax=Rhodococcus sp. 14-2496-1d TaxID=2023146 RepID=UPI0015C5A099|nr:SMP-30/gluconolactonase/LRE family protein [Rhodococcus sp. 14-2496-1d]